MPLGTGGHLPFTGLSFKNLLLPEQQSVNVTTAASSAVTDEHAQRAAATSITTETTTPGAVNATGIITADALMPPSPQVQPPMRGDSLATTEQAARYVVSLSPMCWDPDSVPLLGQDRRPLQRQPLTDYDTGGSRNDLYSYLYNDTTSEGFERCIGVRHKQYKWLGPTGQVYRCAAKGHGFPQHVLTFQALSYNTFHLPAY